MPEHRLHPAKAMLRAADVLGELQDGSEFGVDRGRVSFDMAAAGKHRDKVVKTLTGGVGGLFKKHKIDVLEGTAPCRHGQGRGRRQRSTRPPKVVLATGSVSLPGPRHRFDGRVLDTAGRG